MEGFWQWASSMPWFAWIPIVAILGGCLTSITKMIINHLERMERIRPGDFPPAPRIELTRFRVVPVIRQ